MCRVEERVYISADGHRQTFEDPFLCHRSKHGKMCSNVKRRTTEYFPKPPVTRDDTSSPASINPPTPTGTGSYLVEQRRPSIVERRPSTREGPRPLKPEIIIEFGPRKDRSKKYPAISVKSYKRTSLGASSIGSTDVAIESPGSDASFTVRTGLAETPVPLANPYQQPSGYTTRPALPHSHHRHTSSASSFTTSSQPPSLYATSEPDSPAGRRAPRYPPTIVHNPPPTFTTSASPTVTRATPVPVSSGPYRDSTAAPRDSTPRTNIGPDGLFPLDYSDFHDRSGSSHASSGRSAAPEITDRANERDRLRRLNAESERRRQEEADRRMAQELAQEEAHKRAQEEAKQVRFELGRAEGRAKERGEAHLAESEKRRAEDRDEARRRKQKERDERDERIAKEEKRAKADRLREDMARKEKQIKEAEVKQKRDTRPPTRDPTTKRHHSRRPSISRAEAQERSLLLAETEAQMAREREATEQREREERAAILRQQQQTTEYWDPRGGDRYPVTNEGPGIGRRNSVAGRRPSISSAAPPMGLGRTNSQRRVSIIQPAPPANLPHLNTSFPQQYSTRPPSSHNPPTPLFSPASSTQAYSRPPSARHSSYTQENPFAQPPTRTSQENPFAPAAAVAPLPSRDPWDTRNMREALPQAPPPQARQPSNIGLEQPHTLKQRGENVINRSTEDRARPHDRARQATRNISKIVGFEDDYVSIEDENEADKIAGYGPRLGLGKREKRRN